MLRILYIIILGVLFFGCQRAGDSTDNKEKSEKMRTDLPAEIKNTPQVYYRFPAPNDIVDYIAREKLEYIPTLPNDAIKAEDYISSKDISLNLGVYISDLVYITLFHNLKQSSEYFEVMEILAGKLSLSSIFDEPLKNRIQKNLNNVDSLNLIAKDAYNQMVKRMIANGDEEKLAIISAGAYVESLYLILNQLDSFEQNKDKIQKVFEQKYTFENLLKFMNDFRDNPEIEDIYNEINQIGLVLNKAVTRSSDNKTQVERNNGKLVFSGGGNTIKVTEELYLDLKKTINQIRGEIVSY